MSLEAGNRPKSPVTLAVTAGYFFSLKKMMRENLSSIREKKKKEDTPKHSNKHSKPT